MELRENYRQFGIVLDEADGKSIVHVFGDVDLARRGEFETAIDHVASLGAPIVVDLRNCLFMDSTGITILVRAVKRYGDRVGAVVSDASPLARVLRVTGIPEILPIDFVKTEAAR